MYRMLTPRPANLFIFLFLSRCHVRRCQWFFPANKTKLRKDKIVAHMHACVMCNQNQGHQIFSLSIQQSTSLPCVNFLYGLLTVFWWLLGPFLLSVSPIGRTPQLLTCFFCLFLLFFNSFCCFFNS